jgi:ABC-type Fe3+/spermidine/putrescine transport system ATPase subunit
MPGALLLDEPFSSLDAPLRKEMRREFLDIRSRSDAPCVFVTHDREEAAIVADRIALIAGGRIIETASVKEIFSEPKTESAARFFGTGHVLPCKILEKRHNGIDISSPAGVLTVATPFEFNSEKPMIFIPYDAVSFFNPENTRCKIFSAKVIESIFEGSRLSIKLLLPPWEFSRSKKLDEPIFFELAVSPRVKIPECGGSMDIWIDQSLIRFVK